MSNRQRYFSNELQHPKNYNTTNWNLELHFKSIWGDEEDLDFIEEVEVDVEEIEIPLSNRSS